MNCCKNFLVVCTLCIVVILCFSPLAEANTLLNIDIDGRSTNAQSIPGDMTGAAAIGSAGDQWNIYLVDCVNNTPPIDVDVSGNLVDSSGAITSVTFDLSTGTGDTTADSVRAGNGLLDDYIYLGPNYGISSVAFSFQGLTAGSQYDLYLYGVAGAQSASTYPATFTVGGVDKTLDSTTPFDGTFVENREYVLYSGVTADGSGEISGSVASASQPGFYSVFNGVQIVGDFATVPEPCSMAFLITGALALLVFAWRQLR